MSQTLLEMLMDGGGGQQFFVVFLTAGRLWLNVRRSIDVHSVSKSIGTTTVFAGGGDAAAPCRGRHALLWLSMRHQI